MFRKNTNLRYTRAKKIMTYFISYIHKICHLHNTKTYLEIYVLWARSWCNSANGFLIKPLPPPLMRCNPVLVWRMVATDWDEGYGKFDCCCISVFFHSLELKRSAPGNLQQRVGSGFEILLVDFAKSNEISSSVDSSPCTRDSNDRIPFCELPIYFCNLGQSNRVYWLG